MNIVNKLTLRHLKLNKRRTLVTMIGVVISVAMIMAVATISMSFMDLFQRQAIASEGEWHVYYPMLDAEQIAKLQQDAETEAVVLSRDRGYAQLEGSQNLYKPYVHVREFNEAGFDYFPIVITKGRAPQAADELVISEEIAETAKVPLQIGDTLTLDVGHRLITAGDKIGQVLSPQLDLRFVDGELAEEIKPSETRSYTVVGVIERPSWELARSPGYTVLSYVDEHVLGAGERIDSLVVLEKVKKSLYQHAEKVAEKLGLDASRVDYNNSLLRYYGVSDHDALRKTLLYLTSIIMAVIMLGSVSLIYNAFAISVSERSRHLGMLSSVGATSRQKRNSVFFEGAVIGLISIPVGLVSGLVGIGITFRFINASIKGVLGVTEGLRVAVSPLTVAAACGVSILTIFISTYIPARRASRISAIDAIRQSQDIKLTGKAVKTSRLVRKLFGIEAEIGLKNLKRNRRRYQATVFSLVISILLFLTVSYFTATLRQTAEMTQDGFNYDIQVASHENVQLDPQLVDQITRLEEVTAISEMKLTRADVWVEEDQLADSMVQIAREAGIEQRDGKYRYLVELYAVDDRGLQAYAAKSGINVNQLKADDRLNAIVVNTFSYYNRESGRFIGTDVLQSDGNDPLVLFDTDTDSGQPLGELEVVALTDQMPMGLLYYNIGSIKVIISIDAMDRLIDAADEPVRYWNTLYLTSSDPMKTQRDIEAMQGSNQTRIYNLYQSKQKDEQLIMLLSVFTYGFIILITAISVANILNTITTSVSLRKREFAMLRSVGMTPAGFNKMMNYESIFYGLKSLLYGLPLSFGVMLLIYRSAGFTFEYSFEPPWLSLLIVVVAVFAIVGLAMMYSSARVKRENIIDAIKQESI